MTLCKKIGIGTSLAAVALMLILPATAFEAMKPAAPAEGDVVAPAQLSEWILSGERDYMLVDVRDEDAFLDDAIKTAVSIPLATLDEAARTLPKHKRIVVYGGDARETAKAWRILEPFHDRVELLEDGRAGWEREVLEPVSPPDDADPAAWDDYRERVAVANYFLGKTEVVPEKRERVVKPVLRPRPSVGASEGC